MSATRKPGRPIKTQTAEGHWEKPCFRCKAPETHADAWLGGNYGMVRYCATCAEALGADPDDSPWDLPDEVGKWGRQQQKP